MSQYAVSQYAVSQFAVSQFAVASSLTLAGVFAVAAVTKASRDGFTQFVAMVSSAGVPPGRARSVACAVLAAEAAVAALAATPVGALPAAVLAVALLGGFTVGTALVVRRGAAVACRCFGSGGRITTVHVVRNAVLTGLAGLTVALHVVTEPTWSAATLWAGAIVAVLLGFVAVRFDEVVALLDVRPAATGPAATGGLR